MDSRDLHILYCAHIQCPFRPQKGLLRSRQKGRDQRSSGKVLKGPTKRNQFQIFAIEVQAAQFSRSGPKWCAIIKPRYKFCDKKRGRRNKDALFDHPKFFFFRFFLLFQKLFNFIEDLSLHSRFYQILKCAPV